MNESSHTQNFLSFLLYLKSINISIVKEWLYTRYLSSLFLLKHILPLFNNLSERFNSHPKFFVIYHVLFSWNSTSFWCSLKGQYIDLFAEYTRKGFRLFYLIKVYKYSWVFTLPLYPFEGSLVTKGIRLPRTCLFWLGWLYLSIYSCFAKQHHHPNPLDEPVF